MPPTRRGLRRLRTVGVAPALLLALAAPTGADAELRAFATIRGEILDANRLSFAVWNQGSFAYDLAGFGAGLEYPTGTGYGLAYATGLWIGGKAGSELRTTVAEFGTDFVPGPVVAGSYATDTTRFRVYRVARGDTAGSAAWMARAVPMGAPVDSTGSGPGLIGDQTLWTVFNDMAPVTDIPGHGGRRTSPAIGLEVQLTAYAFDRAGPVRDAAYLRWLIIHKGPVPLDSAYVGLFFDPRLSAPILAASDTVLDLGYSFHTADDVSYGTAAPAVGVMLLRGPVDPASREQLRASSFVVYANGTDPVDSLQYYRALRGIRPMGAPMVDSSTGLVTRFWSSGDPVAGTGWVESFPSHPHCVLSSGPLDLAPGDTVTMVAAIVVGSGQDHLGSVSALKLNAVEGRRLFDEGFASLAPWVPRPASTRSIRAWPSPTRDAVNFGYRVASGGGRVEIVVYDLVGRRVRALVDEWQPGGSRQIAWDGRNDEGATVPAGLYFVRATIAGVASSARVVRVP